MVIHASEFEALRAAEYKTAYDRMYAEILRRIDDCIDTHGRLSGAFSIKPRKYAYNDTFVPVFTALLEAKGYRVLEMTSKDDRDSNFELHLVFRFIVETASKKKGDDPPPVYDDACVAPPKKKWWCLQ